MSLNLKNINLRKLMTVDMILFFILFILTFAENMKGNPIPFCTLLIVIFFYLGTALISKSSNCNGYTAFDKILSISRTLILLSLTCVCVIIAILFKMDVIGTIYDSIYKIIYSGVHCNLYNAVNSALSKSR